MAAQFNDPTLCRIAEFLTSIGLTVRAGEVPPETFLPGLRISSGELEVAEEALLSPGDVLHEAGHLAVTPAAYRIAMDDTITEEDEHPFGGEVEAIAWSYAATLHLGIDPGAIFHEAGYKGSAAQLRFSFGMGVYAGAAGLQAAGLTAVGVQALQLQVPAYPHMLRWLRD